MDKGIQKTTEENQKDEIILFEESNKGNTDNQIQNSENSASVDDAITFDEYYLECCRFGEFKELQEAMKEAAKDFNVNYKDFNGNSSLHMACANGHIEIVKYLIEVLHCNINSQNNSNSTPLNWAALNGQKAVVEFLLKHNADLAIKNKQGKTAGESAYDSGYYDISEMIVQKEYEAKGESGIKEEDPTEEDLQMD